jgi:hypothetical protein
MYLFTLAFWNYAFERAIKTIAQVAVASLTASTFIPTEGDAWVAIGVTSLLAGLVSVLTSLTSYSAGVKTEINVDKDVEAVLSLLQKTAVPAPAVETVVVQEEVATGAEQGPIK